MASAEFPSGYAACRDEDPELFFPMGSNGPAQLQTEEAKKVCGRCNISEGCLQWALETGQEYGVWGGLSEDERKVSKRMRTRSDAQRAAIAATFGESALSE